MNDLDDCTGERVTFALALADAREHPWRYRLPARIRELYRQDFAWLRAVGCDGPVIMALARALRLDQEAGDGDRT